MRYKGVRFLAILAIVVGCSLVIPAVTLAGGTVHTINFESDTPGLKPNGWQSVDSTVTFFSDSMGADLKVADYGPQSHGQALACYWDDPGYLIMDFSVPMCSISLDFGNDDPGWANPGDEAILTLFDGAVQVGQVKVVMNLNDIMDQTVSFSGARFTQATFFYDVTKAYGLIEVVDDIVLEQVIEVDVDIKPGSDPNALNVNSKGVLPVAILGTEQFDVMTVAPGTLKLEYERGIVAPLRWAYEDVNRDGFMDLGLKFDKQALTALTLTREPDGAEVMLRLTGNLMKEYDGTAIAGEDVVVIINKLPDGP